MINFGSKKLIFKERQKYEELGDWRDSVFVSPLVILNKILIVSLWVSMRIFDRGHLSYRLSIWTWKLRVFYEVLSLIKCSSFLYKEGGQIMIIVRLKMPCLMRAMTLPKNESFMIKASLFLHVTKYNTWIIARWFAKKKICNSGPNIYSLWC